MGILIFAGQNTKSNCYDKPETERNYRHNYTNKKAVNNVINDIMRSRTNEENSSDLIGYGAFGCGINIPAEDLINEFLCIQKVYNIEGRSGRRIHHEIFSLSEDEALHLNYNLSVMMDFARECAGWYYRQGFQVIYALHKQGKFHIHFAVNSINYINGMKFHTTKKEKADREILFNQILNRYMTAPVKVTIPVQFYSDYKPIGIMPSKII